MPLSDDDQDEPLSSRRALERADHGKQEKVEQKKNQEQKRELSKLKLDVLRQKMAPQQPEEKKEEEKGEGVKTRTREEEARQGVDSVHSKPGAETIIKKEQQKEEVKRQAVYEQGKDQTA